MNWREEQDLQSVWPERVTGDSGTSRKDGGRLAIGFQEISKIAKASASDYSGKNEKQWSKLDM